MDCYFVNVFLLPGALVACSLRASRVVSETFDYFQPDEGQMTTPALISPFCKTGPDTADRHPSTPSGII